MLEKYSPAANLATAKTNPAASAADIRDPKSRRRPMPLSAPTAANLATGGGGVFEAMMAVNQSQNKIFEEVLDGPVSQQTQRQLAQLQAQNMKNRLADEIADGRERPPAQSQALAEEEVQALIHGQGQTSGVGTADQEPKTRRTLELMAGPTIVSGIETGRVFSPSQMSAFKQRIGLAQNLAATERAARSFVGVAADDEIGRIIRGSQGDGRDTATKVSGSDILETGLAQEQLSSDARPSLDEAGLDDIIMRVGEALGLDPSLIKAVIKTESNFNDKAVSPAGAKGLMQLMPGTAREMGVKDPFNPLDNIWGGARYLKKMLDSYGGNLNKALAAYNWGPGNFNRHGGGGNMPRETRRYIEVVNRNYNRFKKDTVSA
ncbi:MAG: lytic transglycosylase domain-containing protein [Deltaproteobacteria bacterium]|jgi:hypothetical protein|nr:lytic transglycosylase domain-containing protein [Deltaproteobacteria bacterium]